jgi:hypothetical protein
LFGDFVIGWRIHIQESVARWINLSPFGKRMDPQIGEKLVNA